jgi:hypothetical protein
MKWTTFWVLFFYAGYRVIDIKIGSMPLSATLPAGCRRYLPQIPPIANKWCAGH